MHTYIHKMRGRNRGTLMRIILEMRNIFRERQVEKKSISVYCAVKNGEKKENLLL